MRESANPEVGKYKIRKHESLEIRKRRNCDNNKTINKRK